MPIPPVEWASCPPQNIAEQARCLFHTGKMPILQDFFPVPCSLKTCTSPIENRYIDNHKEE
ncbi:MAG: hypothetical protein F6K37_26130 [Moorea sp. SIO4E2]|uniref:hypothetical protein n=1 Tax=Moorena sp. SIO4E2 TaxID=2607826 RepID=UPI0013B908E6|nr:hypothetical protein [Moorena sp. SIO4E2]NEQ09300.1 hypothetical protein [Moorena sp. SIO4E2]